VESQSPTEASPYRKDNLTLSAKV